MKIVKSVTAVVAIVFVAAVATFTSCTTNSDNLQAKVDSLQNELSKITASNEIVARNLAKFDTLDFNVFSRRDWARFHESHSQDVVVHFPDGHSTTGLEKHIQDMEAMFVFAPDTRITAHPIKLGVGNLTAVTGIMEGTFTEAMPVGNGKFIQPTGKAFKVPMATVCIWKEDGTFSEEFLYWDNQTYMSQLGLK